MLWSWICSNIVITRIHASLQDMYDTACNQLPEKTPEVRRCKNRHKPSHGAGKFSDKLRRSKLSSYNDRNCESGRHSRRHTFARRKAGKDRKNTSPTALKVKARTKGETKSPPPRRRDRMTRAIHRRQVAERLKSPIIEYDEPDLCNDYISKDLDYVDRFNLNFPRHCVLGHVHSDSDPLDDLGSWKEVVRPTKKPRSVGPHKSKPKKTTSKKKTNQKNKKSRSVTVLIPEKTRSVQIQIPEPEESRSGEDASTPQR